jgi:UDP-N-acetylmuramoyl-tripeptide--D-alanyl-D-alanine ligase
LFFALTSQGNDGHRYIGQLEGRAGVGAVVNFDFNAAGLTFPLLRVKDPLKAAQQLAVYVRNKYRSIKYIGVTGSAGKTTTKEFIYQILSHKYRVFRSFRNWNNWIGMPFSLLNLTGEEEVAVFELAMSEPGIGEIDLLAGILRPDAAVILNVFPVHLEYLKTLDNTAQAKSEILNHLDSDDVAFINGDSEPLRKRLHHPRYRSRYRRGRKVFFGATDGNDIRLKKITREKEQTRLLIDFYGLETEFSTALINRVQVENLFVAIIVAQHLGMKNFEIQEAVKTLVPLANRGVIVSHGPFTIIDETYNSNPEALKKTLDWVDREYKKQKNRVKVAVLGDMLELGEGEDRFHWEVGQFFAGLGFDRLVTVGKRAEKIAEGAVEAGFSRQCIQRCREAVEAGSWLKAMVSPGEGAQLPHQAILLFKGSRGIQLEKALQEFLK